MYTIQGITVTKGTQIKSAGDLTDLSLTQLAKLYNASGPKRKVKKFKTKNDAVKRVWAVLPKLVGKEKGPGVRQSSFAGKRLYTRLKKNPRRAGSHSYKVWEKILKKPGMTYEEFRKAGGKLVDLSHDVRLKRITVK